MHLLLISGSTRGGSTNSSALRTIETAPPDGVTASSFTRLADLPAFNPDDDIDPLPDAVAELRQQIAASDAVLFCTPEYAGTLPGSFKNLLDWTVGGGEMYRKPVAWINVAAAGRGDGAQATLGMVLGYVGATILPEACGRHPVGHDAVGPDRVVSDPSLQDELRQAAASVARAATAAQAQLD